MPLSKISLFLFGKQQKQFVFYHIAICSSNLSTSSLRVEATNSQSTKYQAVRRRKALICFRPGAAHEDFGSFSTNLLLVQRERNKIDIPSFCYCVIS